MLPIGPLRIEHRRIERMIALVERSLQGDRPIDPLFAAAVIDFLRIYADRTHHGKEEDILFRELAGKRMSPGDARVMEELIEEHRQGRAMVGQASAALARIRSGEEAAVAVVRGVFERLSRFYPEHIRKEDDTFFPAAMRYFERGELDRMLAAMRDFDQRMIHEKYEGIVEEWGATERF